MTPLKNIRENVLGVTQTELSRISGASQPVISRIENGNGSLSGEQMQKIREYAAEIGVAWNDSLFFEVPAAAQLADAAR